MRRALFVTALCLSLGVVVSTQEVFDIYDFDSTAEGPWSDIENTTVTAPKVANGSITVDGDVSDAEYGGFEGVEVVPGTTGWILDYPPDREWDGPDDSSFSFWVAHDDEYFYVGVVAADDIENIDQPPETAWRDDAIEVIIDAFNDDYDVNTDNSQDEYGGHLYATYDGGFSEWLPEEEAIHERMRFSSAVDWTYGEDSDVFVAGKEEDPGWKLEMKLSKRMFESPDEGNKLDDGYEMGFNIGVDDDDMHYEGGGGWTMEIQYFWANRMRPIGFDPAQLVWEIGENPDAWYDTMEDLKADMAADPNYTKEWFDWAINSTGRLSHGGAGSVIFAAGTNVGDWALH